VSQRRRSHHAELRAILRQATAFRSGGHRGAAAAAHPLWQAPACRCGMYAYASGTARNAHSLAPILHQPLHLQARWQLLSLRNCGLLPRAGAARSDRGLKHLPGQPLAERTLWEGVRLPPAARDLAEAAATITGSRVRTGSALPTHLVLTRPELLNQRSGHLLAMWPVGFSLCGLDLRRAALVAVPLTNDSRSLFAERPSMNRSSVRPRRHSGLASPSPSRARRGVSFLSVSWRDRPPSVDASTAIRGQPRRRAGLSVSAAWRGDELFRVIRPSPASAACNRRLESAGARGTLL